MKIDELISKDDFYALESITITANISHGHIIIRDSHKQNTSILDYSLLKEIEFNSVYISALTSSIKIDTEDISIVKAILKDPIKANCEDRFLYGLMSQKMFEVLMNIYEQYIDNSSIIAIDPIDRILKIGEDRNAALFYIPNNKKKETKSLITRDAITSVYFNAEEIRFSIKSSSYINIAQTVLDEEEFKLMMKKMGGSI